MDRVWQNGDEKADEAMVSLGVVTEARSHHPGIVEGAQQEAPPCGCQCNVVGRAEEAGATGQPIGPQRGPGPASLHRPQQMSQHSAPFIDCPPNLQV